MACNPVLWISFDFIKKLETFIYSHEISRAGFYHSSFKTIIDDEAGHYNEIIAYENGLFGCGGDSLAMFDLLHQGLKWQ